MGHDLFYKRNVSVEKRNKVFLALQKGTSKVIYAYHPSDPRSPDYFPKHTKKGSRSLMLLNTAKRKPILPANLTFLDILNNQVSSVFNSEVFKILCFLIIASRLKSESRKPKDLMLIGGLNQTIILLWSQVRNQPIKATMASIQRSFIWAMTLLSMLFFSL